ncbi:hypothetical protein ACFOET_18890 [Parapedobacter deserti]|uniref:Lipoprotein n=1 Tax=Parapedobacter deserti TaxID=1912957 RepID=A0ABV7JWQ1_9SPHI
MKKIFFALMGAFIVSCTHTPPRGDDPVRRDSTGDPIDPMDTTLNRLDPDSVTDTPEVEF